MMLPGITAWPPDFLSPRRRPAESRPLRELPPAFLCAIALYSSDFFFLAAGFLAAGLAAAFGLALVSALAAFEKHPELAVGNAFGSNILNIALVLGITAIILPIKVDIKVIKKEWLVLTGVTLITGLLLLDRHLGQMDGLILLGLLIIFLAYTYRESKKDYHGFDNL